MLSVYIPGFIGEALRACKTGAIQKERFAVIHDRRCIGVEAAFRSIKNSAIAHESKIAVAAGRQARIKDGKV